MTRRVPLPEPVARIYKATAELEALYPSRKFTPDGHLVGSIGEVIAAEALGLTLYPMSKPGHDAFDANGDVQIKLTAGKSIAMYACCVRLVVLRSYRRKRLRSFMTGPVNPHGTLPVRCRKTDSAPSACLSSARLRGIPSPFRDIDFNHRPSRGSHVVIWTHPYNSIGI